jgi:predicted nucleic acid-binding protein
VERLAIGARRRRLEEWLGRELPLRFEGRKLPVDANVADAWGSKMVARSEATGRAIGAMEAFLAATAEGHHLTLVTRKVSDFRVLKAVLNPWT